MEHQEIIDSIDDATGPDNMSKEEAIDFMQNIIGDLQVKVESLELEIEDE